MKIVMFVLALVVSGKLVALEIEPSGVTDSHFVLKGSIEKGDLVKIQRFLKSRKGESTFFEINSNGGYVSEAIDIGLFFKDAFMSVSVYEQCDSACFYILAGAYNRTVFRPVGIHRPYFDAEQYASLSSEDSETAFSNVLSMARKYLEQVHVPDVVVDGMMKASPREMLYLQPNDFERLIGSTSPVKKDWLTAKCDDRSPEDLEKWRLIVEMMNYEFKLKDYAQAFKYPHDLFNAVKELKSEYSETIEAHRANSLLSGSHELRLRNKLAEIRSCKNEIIGAERNRVLNGLSL